MKLINQTSQEYAGWTLGNSDTTVYSAGCTSCAIAISLDIPLLDIVNEPKHYVDNTGSVIGGKASDLILWGSFDVKYIYLQKYYQSPADITLLKKYLSEGYRPILETRFNKNEGLPHFVCAISYEGEKIKVCDPIDGTIKWFNDAYGEPSRWIYQMVVYDKKYVGKPTENSTMISISKETFEMLVTKSDQFDKFVASGFSSVEQVLNTIKQLNMETTNKEKDIEALKQQIGTLSISFSNSQLEVITQKKEIEQLNSSIKQLQEQKPIDCKQYLVKLANIQEYINTCKWFVCSTKKIRKLLL